MAMLDEDDLLQWIDAQAPRMVDLVIDWANLNTDSHNVAGLEQMCRRLEAVWAPTGGVMQRRSLSPEAIIDSHGIIQHVPLGQALWIRKRPETPFRIFMCIHMDTVYPADGPFQSCDWLDASTLRGPGVADAKGGLAIMLILAEAIEHSNLRDQIGWEVLINPDEEIGSPGSSHLFDEAAKRNHLGLLFEPAYGAGDLVSQRAGSGSYVVVIHGRSAHAGRDPRAGRNAIHTMADLIVALAALNSETVTVNVGKVEGGGPVNVVPDLAICRFNVRVTTREEQTAVEQSIQHLVTELSHRDGIRADLHGHFHRPPKPLDAATQRLLDVATQAGDELGLKFGLAKSGGVSDGNQLATAGLPNLDSLGPRGGRIHSADEFLLVDSLAERAKLATLMVLRLANSRIAT